MTFQCYWGKELNTGKHKKILDYQLTLEWVVW